HHLLYLLTRLASSSQSADRLRRLHYIPTRRSPDLGLHEREHPEGEHREQRHEQHEQDEHPHPPGARKHPPQRTVHQAAPPTVAAISSGAQKLAVFASRGKNCMNTP